jgi:hypothetical protein
MNNYVYYDILLAKKRWERSALLVEPRTSLEQPQFLHSPQGGLFAPRASFRRDAVNADRLGDTSPKGYKGEI